MCVRRYISLRCMTVTGAVRPKVTADDTVLVDRFSGRHGDSQIITVARELKLVFDALLLPCGRYSKLRTGDDLARSLIRTFINMNRAFCMILDDQW